MSEDWSLPGYEVLELLGAGASGEVWRARELATGDTVALKRLPEGADPAGLAVLRREATLLRTLETPYVVRLRAVVGEVLVLDHAPGGSLAQLLARRGVLEAGEVVTVAAPLASGLASAHAVGLVHGDVSPSNVLFTAEGMPLLADLGVARLAGEGPAGRVDGTAEYADSAVVAGGEPDAAADVWALAAVCHHLLVGAPPHEGGTVSAVLSSTASGSRAPLGLLAPQAPRALVSAVEAGLEPDPARRPDAAAFASLLRRSHAAAPVRLAAGVTCEPALVRKTHVVRAEGLEAAGRHSRTPLVPAKALAVAALAVAVGLAAGVGWLSGRSGAPAAAAVPALARPAPPAVAPPQVPAAAPQQLLAAAPLATPAHPPEWPVLLTELDAVRASAFAEGDVARLSEVWAPGSPGLAADTAALRALTDQGRSASGLRHSFRSVAPVAVDPAGADAGTARLRIVDVLAAHEIRDRAGTVVQRVPVRAATTWEVELVRSPAGWRIVTISGR